MATIVVLFELESDLDLGAEGVGPAVLMVHAAGADPDAPEDPQAWTLCGKDTTPMEHAHYSPTRPGEPWYPPVFGAQRDGVAAGDGGGRALRRWWRSR
ncbi:hypothetical protein ACIRYZ_46185 [Kitasatospora sp. NPDC101155]|uniref:hypothetical protein n=1 Tax=Kitasatospora sp. NPDC101155 TaxID=3364097 RepID=UPI0038067FF2